MQLLPGLPQLRGSQDLRSVMPGFGFVRLRYCTAGEERKLLIGGLIWGTSWRRLEDGPQRSRRFGHSPKLRAPNLGLPLIFVTGSPSRLVPL